MAEHCQLNLYEPPRLIGQIAFMGESEGYQVMFKNGAIYTFPLENWQEAAELAERERDKT